MNYTFMDRSKRALEFWHWREQGVALVIAVLAFTVLGPFETSALPLILRFAYWGICISAGWVFVILMLMLFLRHPRLDDWPAAFRVGLAILISSVPICGVVAKVEWVIRGSQLDIWSLLNVLFICALIGGLMYLRVSARLGIAGHQETPTRASFLKRLPHDLGGEIVSLSTQDHYVEVTTQKGTTLILIRFQDAIAELDTYGGVQIHRSHWVAKDAVHRVMRQDGKRVVQLHDGRTLPVSRTYAGSAKAVFG